MLRRLAEIILGNLTVSRTLPASVGSGRVVATPRVGGLRYLFRPANSLDPTLMKIASAVVRKGDNVWDVGGNVGLFASAAAGLAGPDGRVYSIEADADAYALLNKTARAQNSETHAAITALNTAISNQCGCVQFNVANRSRSTNSIAGFGSTQTGGVKERRHVPALTLDTLLKDFSPPQVVKIDVEGAEVLVLQGACELLTRIRPVLIVEVASEVGQEVARILRSHDYRLFDGGTLSPIEPDQPAAWDTVAIPADSPRSLLEPSS